MNNYDDMMFHMEHILDSPLEYEMGVTPLSPSILKPEADLKFTDLQDRTLDVTSITLENGIITKITAVGTGGETQEYSAGSFFLIKEMLEIPGIGRLSPGTIVRYKGKDYLLLFGWHTNPSNQTIYSWYLTKNNECHTLYQEMIDLIDLVKVSRN